MFMFANTDAVEIVTEPYVGGSKGGRRVIVIPFFDALPTMMAFPVAKLMK